MQMSLSRLYSIAFMNVARVIGVAAVLSLNACNLDSDAKLMSRFQSNRPQFQELADMASADQGVARIRLEKELPKELDIPLERWRRYNFLFQKLNLREGMEHRVDFASGSFFIAECTGTAITRDCKGYVYSQVPLAPIAGDLDAPPARIVFRVLTGNWYLFRDDG